MKEFDEILKDKREYYGNTEAAIQFAAEEFARQSVKTVKLDADVREWVAIKDKLPPVHKRVVLYDVNTKEAAIRLVHEFDLETQHFQKNWTHWILWDDISKPSA